MWIVLIAVLEALRFFLTWSAFSSSYIFQGFSGFVCFAVLDWLFFFICLPVLDYYLHFWPCDYLRRDTRLGNWLRARIKLQVEPRTPTDPELDPTVPYVFACHGHGILATAELALFMMYSSNNSQILKDFPGRCISTVSSQLWMFPLTQLVCRALGAQSVGFWKLLLDLQQPIVISPGGAHEISLAEHDTSTTLHILKRVGFLRDCYNAKRTIVPLLVLGNHSMFSVVKRQPFRKLQGLCFKAFGYGLPILALGSYGTIIPRASASVKVVCLPAFQQLDADESLQAYIERYYTNLVSTAEEHGTELRLIEPKNVSQFLYEDGSHKQSN